MGKFDKAHRSRELAQAGQLVAAVQHRDDGKLLWLKVNRIEHDLKQPRRLYQLGITPDAIIAHRDGHLDLSQHENPEVRERFAGILALADSIRMVGLQQPIVARVKDGSDPANPVYILVAGARRHLAHLLIALDEIPSIVRVIAGETTLRASQLVENMQREDLTALEVILGMAELNELHKATTERNLKGKDIVELLGVRRSQAFIYRGLIHASIEVVEALQEGLITSLELAYDINRLDQEERQVRLAQLRVGEPLVLPAPAAAPPPAATESPASAQQRPQRGRPPAAVSLGKTENTQFVRDLVARYLGEQAFADKFGDVDWGDLKAAKRAWGRFIEMTEEQDHAS